jgi:hypothetical protein
MGALVYDAPRHVSVMDAHCACIGRPPDMAVKITAAETSGSGPCMPATGHAGAGMRGGDFVSLGFRSPSAPPQLRSGQVRLLSRPATPVPN